MDYVFRGLFVHYLGTVVQNYQVPPEAKTWQKMEQEYKNNGFDIYSIGVCEGGICTLRCQEHQLSVVPYTKSENLQALVALKEQADVQTQLLNHVSQNGVSVAGDRHLNEQRLPPPERPLGVAKMKNQQRTSFLLPVNNVAGTSVLADAKPSHPRNG